MATDYPVPTRLYGLLAKLEGTYGSDASPVAGTDGVRLMAPPEVETDYLAPNMRDDFFTGGLGVLAPDLPKGQFHRIRGSIPIIGGGAAYSSSLYPNAHPFLLAAGFAATLDATGGSESYTYDYTDAPYSGITIYTYKEGKQYISLGCVVSEWLIRIVAGQFPVMEWTAIGFGSNPTEVDLPSITLGSTLPPKFVAGNVTIGSYSPVIRQLEIRGGNTVASRGDGNATDAHAGYRITRRQPELVVRVEHADITDYNPESEWTSRTQRTFDADIGSTQYEHFSIDIDDMRVNQYRAQDDQGLSVPEVSYKIYTPSSGNELSLLFD